MTLDEKLKNFITQGNSLQEEIGRFTKDPSASNSPPVTYLLTRIEELIHEVQGQLPDPSLTEEERASLITINLGRYITNLNGLYSLLKTKQRKA